MRVQWVFLGCNRRGFYLHTFAQRSTFPSRFPEQAQKSTRMKEISQQWLWTERPLGKKNEDVMDLTLISSRVFLWHLKFKPVLSLCAKVTLDKHLFYSRSDCPHPQGERQWTQMLRTLPSDWLAPLMDPQAISQVQLCLPLSTHGCSHLTSTYLCSIAWWLEPLRLQPTWLHKQKRMP